MHGRIPHHAPLHRRAPHAAFTLVELATVMVVIGLIIGSVLVGRDLITAARINGQITQIKKFDEAAYAFRLKYSCLPGDCPTMATTFPALEARNTPSSTLNGNNNKLLNDSGGNVLYPTTVWSEPRHFWTLLMEAGYLGCCEGSGTNTLIGMDYPRMKANESSGIGVLSLEGRNGYFLGYNRTFAAAGVAAAADLIDSSLGTLSPREAQMLDRKMDDGLAVTGNVYAVHLNSGDGSIRRQVFDAAEPCLTNTSPPDYDLSYGSTACAPFFEMQ